MVEAYFMGGPADGTYRAVQCEDPMDPPRRTQFITAPDLARLVAEYSDGNSPPPSEPIRTVEHVYLRQPSQMNDGPLWVYAYQPRDDAS